MSTLFQQNTYTMIAKAPIPPSQLTGTKQITQPHPPQTGQQRSSRSKTPEAPCTANSSITKPLFGIKKVTAQRRPKAIRPNPLEAAANKLWAPAA